MPPTNCWRLFRGKSVPEFGPSSPPSPPGHHTRPVRPAEGVSPQRVPGRRLIQTTAQGRAEALLPARLPKAGTTRDGLQPRTVGRYPRCGRVAHARGPGPTPLPRFPWPWRRRRDKKAEKGLIIRPTRASLGRPSGRTDAGRGQHPQIKGPSGTNTKCLLAVVCRSHTAFCETRGSEFRQ